jgi:hypothetical protein
MRIFGILPRNVTDVRFTSQSGQQSKEGRWHNQRVLAPKAEVSVFPWKEPKAQIPLAKSAPSSAHTGPRRRKGVIASEDW